MSKGTDRVKLKVGRSYHPDYVNLRLGNVVVVEDGEVKVGIEWHEGGVKTKCRGN